MKFLNLLGQKFYRLTVVERIANGPRGVVRWRCLCDCGVETEVRTAQLRDGTKKSCGCLLKDVLHARAKPGRGGFSAAYACYRFTAKNRGFAFELSREAARRLMLQNCAYCGAAPSNVAKANGCSLRTQEVSTFIYNGIDRVNNDLGYTPENCVSCCSTCNRMKLDHSLEKFLDQVNRIAVHTKTLPMSLTSASPAA